MTLRAFEIDNPTKATPCSDLTDNLIIKLRSQRGKAKDRRMLLSSESQDEDILTDFSIKESAPYVWGVMWRIAPTKETPNIPENLFEKEKITAVDINSKDGKSNLLTRKDLYYFIINRQFLVTNLPKNRIKSLQDYLNWFLTIERGNNMYSFTPLVSAPENTKLCDIKNIVIGNHGKKHQGGKKVIDLPKGLEKIYNLATEKIKGMVNEIPDFEELKKNNILSASLVINFKKPSKMKDEDYGRMLGTFMKPIGEDEDVSFKLKDGKQVRGKEVLRTKKIDVELLEGGIINEKSLMLDMEKFINDLNDK